MSALDETKEHVAAAVGPWYAREPLAMWIAPLPPRADRPGMRSFRFEYSSRGDRVPGLLLLPEDARGPYPLVLLEHGAGGSKDSDYLDAARLPWVRRGVAVASVDLPLHGERASAKLTEILLAGLATVRGSERTHALALWEGFATQALHDLGRALDVLLPHPEIDGDRVGYAAFSLGSIIGALYCAREPRLRAAALALGGGGFGPPDLDPVRHIARFGGRPLLLVNATGDERIPRSAADALHEAAADPKELLWFDSGHHDLPGRALKAMWLFLARSLEA
jgi:dienelactone hydrolase